MDERPNFYLLLELDAKVEDAAAIAKAILAKKQSWSKQSLGNPALAGAAKANLARIPEIERVLSDPEARRNEATEALRQLKILRQKGLAEVDRAIAVLRGGSCTNDDIAKLVKLVNGNVTEAEVAKRVRAAGISVESTGAAAGPAAAVKPRLDAARMDQMRPDLERAGAKTLYEFLGMVPRSSAQSLRECADQRNRELQNIGKVDAATNTAKALCGQCMAIFINEENKQKYDNSLAIEAMHSMRPLIELVGGSSNYLTVEQQDELVRQARKNGVDVEDARTYIVGVATSRKWRLQRAVTLPSGELQQCGRCSALAKPNATHCAECGAPLSIECPRCSKTVKTEYPACINCGFHIGDWDLIKAKLDAARVLIRDGQIDESAKQLKVLLHKQPGLKALQVVLDEAERLIKERQAERAGLDDLVRQSKLFQTQSEAEKFRRKWQSKDVERLLSSITDGIARATAAFRDGERRRSEGKSEEAIVRYREAIGICADYDAARKAMALIAPHPPKDLVVEPQGSGFHLRWVGRDKTIDSYVVVRKARAAPNDIKDGVHTHSLTDTVYTDRDVPEGVPWHYAVFSCRDGVSSAGAARGGPCLRVAPVQKLSALSGAGEVKLTWSLPNGAVRVEVWRRQGSAPDRRGLGTQLSPAREHLHDTGLPNDLAQGYFIVPVFEDPRRVGEMIYGPGTACQAIPTAPPAPILDLTYQRETGGVRLNWTPPAGPAQVQIQQLNMAPNLSVGTILTKAQADSLGTPVLAASPGSAQVRLPGVVETWFVPLTVKATIAVVGKHVSIALVEGLHSLTVDHDSRDIHLSWKWPPGATRAAVCYSYDAYPKAPDGGGTIRQEITLNEYKRNGMFTMRGVERRAHYFSLFATTTDGRLHSEPLTRLVQMGQSREVRYRIISPKSFFARLTGRASKPELEMKGFGHMPETILVAKPRVVPRGPDDGEKLLHIPEMELAGTCRVPIPRTQASSGNVVKLFFVNGSHVEEIKLISGPLHELKL
jgi:hypothetical protein